MQTFIDRLKLAHLQQLLWVSESIFFFDLVTIFACFFWTHFFSPILHKIFEDNKISKILLFFMHIRKHEGICP